MLHTAISSTQHEYCALPLIMTAGSPTATHICSADYLGSHSPTPAHPLLPGSRRRGRTGVSLLHPLPLLTWAQHTHSMPAAETAPGWVAGSPGSGQVLPRSRSCPPSLAGIGVPPAPLTQSLPIERSHLQALLLQVELPGGAPAPEPQALHGGTLGSGRLPAACSTGWSLKGGPTAGAGPGRGRAQMCRGGAGKGANGVGVARRGRDLYVGVVRRGGVGVASCVGVAGRGEGRGWVCGRVRRRGWAWLSLWAWLKEERGWVCCGVGVAEFMGVARLG